MASAILTLTLIAAIVAFVVRTFRRARALEDAQRTRLLGPCRRCGADTAWMHNEVVHVDRAGEFVAFEHRPLPEGIYGPQLPRPTLIVPRSAKRLAMLEADEMLTLIGARALPPNYDPPATVIPIERAKR